MNTIHLVNLFLMCLMGIPLLFIAYLKWDIARLNKLLEKKRQKALEEARND